MRYRHQGKQHKEYRNSSAVKVAAKDTCCVSQDGNYHRQVGLLQRLPLSREK